MQLGRRTCQMNGPWSRNPWISFKDSRPFPIFFLWWALGASVACLEKSWMWLHSDFPEQFEKHLPPCWWRHLTQNSDPILIYSEDVSQVFLVTWSIGDKSTAMGLFRVSHDIEERCLKLIHIGQNTSSVLGCFASSVFIPLNKKCFLWSPRLTSYKRRMIVFGVCLFLWGYNCNVTNIY